MPAAQRLPLYPHNASLHIWLELGVVGAVLAAALAASLLLASGTGALAAGVVGVVASASVTGLLSFAVWQPWWVAALTLCVVSIAALRRQ